MNLSETSPDIKPLSDYLTLYDAGKGDLAEFIQQLAYNDIPLTLEKIIIAGAKNEMLSEDAKIVKVGKFRTLRETRRNKQGKVEIVRFPIIMIEYEGGRIIFYHFPQVN